VNPVLLSAIVAAAVGAGGTALVLLLGRRSIRAAAVTAPIVVVVSFAAGIVASVQTMAISDTASDSILLVLAATLPVAAAAGLVLAWQLRVQERAAAMREADRERDRQVEQRRRELVSWMSHDLRTPLAGMTAITEALQDGVAPDPQVYLARLHTDAMRLDAMIGDLLALSRLQGPGGGAVREEASMRDLVSGVLELAGPVADRAGVRLDGEAHQSVPVTVDSGQVARAVTNLVVNAIRHTPAGGEVRVGVREADGSAVVDVADECGGIPESHLPHVFEPGWRGREARSPGDGAGAGLGLAIARGVAEVHGGNVTVRNDSGGCVFTLRLPLTPRPADRGVEPKS